MGGAVARQSADAAPAARAPEPGRSHERRRVQTALKLSDPGDAAEREAVATARAVMRMPDPVVPARARVPMLAARAPAAAPAPKAKKDEVSPELTAEIKSQVGGGRPLSPDTRSFLEPRFKANFAGVRVHTGGKAENLATRLGARAFTFGKDIFFNAGAYKPDSPEGMELIAHELTHTIQQQEVVQRDLIQREEAVTVQERGEPQVQRGIVSEALDWIADKANVIPGFRLFTIIIGRNPINMSKVDRSGANILRALIEFIPGGGLIVQALENHGIFEKGGKFIEDQFAALRDLGGAVRDALMEFIDSLGWRDIFRLGSLWDRAKRIFTTPIDKAIAFGKGLVSGIATLVKDAIIKPLGRWAANNIPKWNLLVGVFGKNPISDEGESPASALIGAFMELIGQKEIWENIKKGNAVARAWAWFQGAMKGALSLVTSIPGRVMSTIRSLTIFDIVTLVGAFQKIVGAFSSFVGDFMRWAGGTVLQLLEIILTVVAPRAVPYLKKAGGAFSSIIKNPIGFVRTLVRAGIQGFRQFARNFLQHLKASLIGWLTGALGGAGIYIPSGFTLIEILKFVLSVMGLTWANIRAKLVKATNETVVKALETGFDIVKTLVTEGPAAAWQKIVETLTNLKQMAIDAVMDFVKSKVVEAAVTKLLSMLSPAGAFIQAIIAIYNTIMFFVERIRQIAQVAAAFIDGIAAIAAGNIAPAANKVEQTMAGLLTLVISFLARIAGLGKVSDAVLGLVKKIRAPIDKALDKVVDWIVATARKLGKFIAQAGVPHDPQERLRLAARDAVALVQSKASYSPAVLTGMLAVVRTRYGLTDLKPVKQDDGWWVELSINPAGKQKLPPPDPQIVDVAAKVEPNLGILVTCSVTIELAPLPNPPKNAPNAEQLLAPREDGTFENVARGTAVTSAGGTNFIPFPAEQTSGAFVGKSKGGKRAPRTAVMGQPRVGGAVLVPASGSPTVTIVGWNTANNIFKGNASHAEKQVASWLTSRPREWLNRIIAIKVNISASPCSIQTKQTQGNCTSLLIDMIRDMKNLQKAEAKWAGLYHGGSDGDSATKTCDVMAMINAGFEVNLKAFNDVPAGTIGAAKTAGKGANLAFGGTPLQPGAPSTPSSKPKTALPFIRTK